MLLKMLVVPLVNENRRLMIRRQPRSIRALRIAQSWRSKKVDRRLTKTSNSSSYSIKFHSKPHKPREVSSCSIATTIQRS